MSVRAFLLVSQLVVVCSEPSAAIAARIGLLTSMDAHVTVPCGSIIESLSTDGTLLPLLWVPHTSGLQLLHVVVQLHLCIDVGHSCGGITEVESLTGSRLCSRPRGRSRGGVFGQRGRGGRWWSSGEGGGG